jgi:hypothetical protein
MKYNHYTDLNPPWPASRKLNPVELGDQAYLDCHTAGVPGFNLSD